MNYSVVFTEILTAFLGLALLVAGLLFPGRYKKLSGYVSVLCLLCIFLIDTFRDAGNNSYFFAGLYALDALAITFKQIFIIASVLVILMSQHYIERLKEFRCEYFSLITFALLGMMVMASANDLITLYIGLELMTISFVILTVMDKASIKSSEAGMKYITLSAISSGILLYGMSLFYGFSGSTTFKGLVEYLKDGRAGPMFAAAIAMIIAGFGFKISAVPFHMWTPDIYEGAPTPVTAFLAIGSKMAGFAVLIRLLLEVLPSEHAKYGVIVITLAVLTMIIGNLIAIPQKSIKRLLAYSSIAHAGYILLGLVAFSSMGVGAILYYIYAYIFANAGAFAAVIAFSNQTGSDEISDYSGMWKRSPLIAAVLMVSLLSLAGIPPAAGFVGKFYLFASIIRQGHIWLAILAIIMSIVSVYYYIVVIRVMLVGEVKTVSPVGVPVSLKIVMVISAAATLFLGVYPGPVTDWTTHIAALFIK